MDDSAPGYDVHRVAAAFAGAAADYDRHAHLQHVVAGDLAARLAGLGPPPGGNILEIGCGTGFVTRALADHRPSWLLQARWLLTDIAPPMLDQAGAKLAGFSAALSFAVCDAQTPPFAGGRFGLIYSSLTLQWIPGLSSTLARLAGLLAPGGELFVTLLGEGSLAEWRTVCAARGLDGAAPAYPDPDCLGDVWPSGGVGEVSADQCHRRPYPDALAFLRELRGLGATAPVSDYAPLGGGELRALLHGLPRPFTVTYRVITLRYRRDPVQAESEPGI